MSLNIKSKRIKIQKILSYLNQVKKIHEKYMSNGKKFIHTIELRDINEKILILINEINLWGDEGLENSCLDLIEHLHEWISIWDKEKKIRRPRHDDEFIFYGYKKYPKNLESLLVSHLTKLGKT